MIRQFVDLKAQYADQKKAIDERIRRVLEHGGFILGPEVDELERRLAEYVGARFCLTCASGTDALLLALMALDIKAGDEVVTTPFTFIATAEVIVLAGATPVYVDIEADSCNLDPKLLDRAIGPRTRAIMPVSLYGQPASMDEIGAIAARHGVPVIEDAAQSFGAQYRGKRSGHLSEIGCTSFFPSKPLGCYGDGGALFTDDAALAQALGELRNHGQTRRYHHSRVGISSRLDSLQCAVLLAKLERLDWELEQRQRIAARYTERLSGIPGVRPPRLQPGRTSVYGQYTIRVPDRDAFCSRMRDAGVPTAVHYPVPVHRQPAYAASGSFPESDAAAAEVVSLPMDAYLGERDQDLIVDAVRACVK